MLDVFNESSEGENKTQVLNSKMSKDTEQIGNFTNFLCSSILYLNFMKTTKFILILSENLDTKKIIQVILRLKRQLKSWTSTWNQEKCGKNKLTGKIVMFSYDSCFWQFWRWHITNTIPSATNVKKWRFGRCDDYQNPANV